MPLFYNAAHPTPLPLPDLNFFVFKGLQMAMIRKIVIAKGL
jgi:hypothetical protein